MMQSVIRRNVYKYLSKSTYYYVTSFLAWCFSTLLLWNLLAVDYAFLPKWEGSTRKGSRRSSIIDMYLGYRDYSGWYLEVLPTVAQKFEPLAQISSIYVHFTDTHIFLPLYTWSSYVCFFWKLQMMLNSKYLSFVGYTYKNFDAVKGIKRSGLFLIMTLSRLRAFIEFAKHSLFWTNLNLSMEF
jgi:hypothetical protein